MVTNALNLALANAGIANARNGLDTESSIYNYPLWQHYLGGILLFNKTIEEDANNILFPDGNAMIGNGAYGVANSNEVTEMGSWNESESGIQEDGSLRLVWDFSTQQANGTISCACLSSRAGAYIGAGNSSGAYNGNSVHTVNGKTFGGYIGDYAGPNVRRIYGNALETLSEVDNSHIVYADYLDNTITFLEPRTIYYNASGDTTKHWSQTGNIKLSKYRYGLSAVDLLETREVTKQISSIEVPVPDSIQDYVGGDYTNNWYGVTTVGDTVYLVFWASTGIAIDGTIKIMKITSSGEVTVYDVVNTTGVALKTGIGIFSITESGYLVVEADSSPYDFYAINILDNTDVKKIENTLQKSIGYFTRRSSGNSAYFIATGITYKIDVELGLLQATNGYTDKVPGANYETPVINNPLLVLFGYTQKNETQSVYLYRSDTYLATINNLEEPVVKTASKTMKVTYTITFD